MLKNKNLTYISLFSSAGVGCYGFKTENFQCIATNELLSKRIDIQKANDICQFKSGYVQGDIAKPEVKELIYNEIQKWKKIGNDRVDVVIATPPCQGISVINHKKNKKEIERNSLVVESIEIVKKIYPRFFIFENVMAFQKTLCSTPNGQLVPIGDLVRQSLGDKYTITCQVLNLMNYGSNSSRTRTLMIGVDKKYRNSITPYDLLPSYEKEKTLRDIIYKYPRLKWGQIYKDDFYHAFRTYNSKMRGWISNLNEGESAFDNLKPENRPHRIINDKIVENVRNNRDKYTRQLWDRFIQCIHTRNDQLAAQNTIHPEQDRVYSIRELMEMMTIPKTFKWIDCNLRELNKLTIKEKLSLYKKNELNIRRCIGEAVPTESMRRIAKKIKETLLIKLVDPNEIRKIITEENLDERNNLENFLKNNKLKLDVSVLMRITELCNAKREENAAFYTNKFIVNEILEQLPKIKKDEIRILEPSVGAGNFIPYIIKKYGHIKKIILDVVDIDEKTIACLRLILEKIVIPENFKINIICADFLLMDFQNKYDLIIGNPPFSKVNNNPNLKRVYLQQNLNKQTSNLSEMFFEKCLRTSDCVALVLNKTILTNYEFNETRNLLKQMRISTIIDFGRYGFSGVSIETMCIIVHPKKKPKNTLVYSLKHNLKIDQDQIYITDPNMPYFIIYRDKEFDSVAEKLEFNIFGVFRDRQITKSITTSSNTPDSLWVVKARNIKDNGQGVKNIKDYDQYISKETAQNLSVYKYVNDSNIYLTPNMTYNPRVIENIPNSIADGSTAILIPKKPLKLSPKQMNYFSTDEYRRFYKIARNLSTQSINIDKTSVYFFGKLIE